MTVPVYYASYPDEVSYIMMLENAQVGVVLEGFTTLFTVNVKVEDAARVPEEKVKTAVTT